MPNHPRPYLLVFPLLYLGVFAAGSYYEAAGLCGGFSSMRLALLAGVLLVPFGLELLEQRRYPDHTPRRAALALLAARLLLFEVVAAADCSGFSKFLYLIVPFTAYFLDRRLSVGLALFYVGLVVARLWVSDPAWYLRANYISDVLIFSIGLAFAIAMAAVVSQEENSRRRAERLVADLKESHTQLAAYAEQAAGLAAAEERNRLARDIHDSLGHYLAVISVQLEKALAFRQRDAAAADTAVSDARQAAREALTEVRQSVGALRAGDGDFDLAAALGRLADEPAGGPLHVELRLEGEAAGYPPPVRLALYRIAQEGLTNVRKHAQATQATLHVTLGETAAGLTLRDNGRGLASPEAAPPNGHFGWQGMRERLALLGGSLRVASTPGTGTCLTVTIPKAAPVEHVLGGPGV